MGNDEGEGDGGKKNRVSSQLETSVLSSQIGDAFTDIFPLCCRIPHYVHTRALPIVCWCLLACLHMGVSSFRIILSHIGCFVSIFCNCCASYAMRKRTLYNDMSRYICCGGHCPCSGKMNEDQCPEFCLCLETVCCFAQSVASTRFMIQDEMHLENTPCDNCLVVRTHTYIHMHLYVHFNI